MLAINPQETASVVTLTIGAADQIKHLLATDEANVGKALRLYVEKGGCSGLKYSMVFDEKRDGDTALEVFGAPVVIDEFSAGYLKGCVLDFSDSLTEGGFKISNPNAKQSCGCGKSFEV